MLYRTGQIAPQTGRYEFAGYIDGTTDKQPTAQERIIPLGKGETFPPIRSTGKAAFWRLIS